VGSEQQREKRRLSRPKRVANIQMIAGLHARGVGWKKISKEMGIGVGTLYWLAVGWRFQNSGNGFLNP
jgi:hypothetical protein